MARSISKNRPSPNSVLPLQPNLEHLRNEAKALLKAHAARDAGVSGTLRLLHRFEKATDAEILAAELALSEAPFALALDYGLKSWEQLKRNSRVLTR